MPHDLDALPWREVGVELVALLIELSLERLQLRLGVGDVLLELDLQGVDLLLQLDQRLLKFQRCRFHREWKIMPAARGKINAIWAGIALAPKDS